MKHDPYSLSTLLVEIGCAGVELGCVGPPCWVGYCPADSVSEPLNDRIEQHKPDLAALLGDRTRAAPIDHEEVGDAAKTAEAVAEAFGAYFHSLTVSGSDGCLTKTGSPKWLIAMGAGL